MLKLATLEYYQWRLTGRLVSVASEGETKKAVAGVRKALEVFCLASYEPGAPWPPLYSRSSSTTSVFARKLEGDFRRVGVSDPTNKVGRVVDEIRTTADRLSQQGAVSPMHIKTSNSGFTMGKFSVKWTPRTQLLAGMCGVESVAAMLLRYKAALAESAQWSIPPPVYTLLHKELDCTGEGFASPINSFMLPYGRNAAFCSLFPDTDAQFNSKGSVWDLKDPGSHAKGWVLNPPFTLYHLNKSSNLAMNWMRRDPELRVVLVGRGHAVGQDQSAQGAKQIQIRSPYDSLLPKVQAHIDLPMGKHYYITPQGQAVTAQFPTSLYICGRPLEDPSAVERIRDAFCHGGKA